MGYSLSPAHLDDNQKTDMRKRKTWHPLYDHKLKQLWPDKLAIVAQAMGFSQRTIQAAVNRLGLQRAKKGHPGGSRPDIIRRDEQIRREAGAGVSMGTLVDRYSLSSRRIQQIISDNGKEE